MVFANLKTSFGKPHGQITRKSRPLNNPGKHMLSSNWDVLSVEIAQP